MEIERRIKDLHALESDLFDKGYIIAERIKGNSDYRKDIRYTTYNTLSSVIRSNKLLLVLKSQFLNQDDWWHENYGQHFSYLDNYFGISENYRETLRKKCYGLIPDDLVKYIIVGLYSSSFSIMESRFRLFYNYFIQSQRSGEKGEIMDSGNIRDISEELLNQIGFCHKIDCIELFSNIRNTVHNNGVYTKAGDIIVYNRKLYKFEKFKPPNYGDSLDLLISEILPDVIEVLDKLISELMNETTIEDPFTKNHSLL